MVEHREIEAVGVRHVAELAARDVADAGPLDLDHIGAEPGEKLRAGRAGLDMGEVEDAHAVERLAGAAPGLARRRAKRGGLADRRRALSPRHPLQGGFRGSLGRGAPSGTLDAELCLGERLLRAEALGLVAFFTAALFGAVFAASATAFLATAFLATAFLAVFLPIAFLAPLAFFAVFAMEMGLPLHHLYIVWFLVPGAYSFGSTQMLTTADLPVFATRSRASRKAGAIFAASRTSTPQPPHI